MIPYLLHHFDPFFNHQAVRPVQDETTGAVNWFNLGYVQNVFKGQLLAEIVDGESVPRPDLRFVLQEAVLPMGPGTCVDPANPARLLAAFDGYVLYENGLISVHDTLNVRTHVDFHTGNVYFVGILVLHMDLRAGFNVHGRSVVIRGMVEGGRVRADESLVVRGGVRGGSNNSCRVSAQKIVRVGFCEKAELRSSGTILVDRFAMHSTLYSVGPIIVEGKAMGGLMQARQKVFVRDSLGNMAGIPTRIYLGYDPFIISRFDRCNQRLDQINEKLVHLEAVAGHLPPDTNELTCKLAQTRYRHDRNMALRDVLRQRLAEDEKQLDGCRLVVLGTVYPGVEISIGHSIYVVEKPLDKVAFTLRDGRVEVAEAVHPYY